MRVFTLVFFFCKRWIDLTNWGLVVCSVQAWLGAMIVTQGLMVDRDDFGRAFIIRVNGKQNLKCFRYFSGMQRKVKKGWLRHAYWILNTIATVYSFIITFFFWTMLHDPGKDDIFIISVEIHFWQRLSMNVRRYALRSQKRRAKFSKLKIKL